MAPGFVRLHLQRESGRFSFRDFLWTIDMITSVANPRIKEARKLQRSKARRRQQRLLLEGVRLVEDAWKSGVRPDTIFFDPALLTDNPRGLALIQRLEEAQVACLACASPAFAALADTVAPQGVAAVVPWPHLPLPKQPSLALVLDRVRDPGNAGTLLRAAEAAGVDILLFGPETVDPYNDKVVRAAMGAHFRLPLRTCASWEEIDALLEPSLPRYLADVAGSLPYDAVDWRAPASLIVGGEADGAGDAARARAQLISIPMLGQAESLNAAVAGAVILFEAARQRR
jgi:TrmH family RNA methyltransferase